ncbi:MAG: glucosamine-6-phosphate deaminase [Planctomycetes bacterium]|nr:glucosamine-6-phosphate deaminase [Planctomycetota bacterium]
MEKFVFKTPQELGQAAAEEAVKLIKAAIADKDYANIILATGTSQFETIKNLTETPGIDWSKVTMFHLDEYIGLDITCPASFRKYLKERFVDKVKNLNAVYFINADCDDPAAECERLSQVIADHSIDAAMVGIGENGHLAFNDPPADFGTEKPYIIVQLDEKCRKQQLGEGWFETFDDVPAQAISMGIKQIMKSQNIIVSVPDRRKAQAVKDTIEGEVTNMCPASILQNHPSCKIFLDEPAASLLVS